jgi:hypothetical protein
LRHYRAYGVSILSELPLPLREAHREFGPTLYELEIRLSERPLVGAARQEVTPQSSPLPGSYFGQMLDGSSYVRWDDVGEALISRNGRSIACRPFPQTDPESFYVYLLGQALSFALVKGSFEPLHATAVAVGDQAIAFLGDCGFGKSTLAAAFLQAGHRLLTDDLLLLETTPRGILAHPGPARIKLFPKVARHFLADGSRGVPLNPRTQKQIIPLNERQVCIKTMTVGAIYVLAPPNKANDNSVRVASLTEREAFFSFLGNTFNRAVVDADRLRRQFNAAQALANIMTVGRLSYPRSLDHLRLVREAILSDLCARNSEIAACKA